MSRQASTSKKPRKDSVAWKVVDFLEGNPGEELTRHDIAEKFDIDPVQVDDALRTVMASGHIVRELARRASINMGEHLGATDTYMRLALRAQAQCARTVEALATIKNPPMVFARQANIANQQIVSNGPVSELTPTREQYAPARAHAADSENMQNKLLEASYGERMDLGAQATASGTHQDLATMGQVNRPQD